MCEKVKCIKTPSNNLKPTYTIYERRICKKDFKDATIIIAFGTPTSLSVCVVGNFKSTIVKIKVFSILFCFIFLLNLAQSERLK